MTNEQEQMSAVLTRLRTRAGKPQTSMGAWDVRILLQAYDRLRQEMAEAVVALEPFADYQRMTCYGPKGEGILLSSHEDGQRSAIRICHITAAAQAHARLTSEAEPAISPTSAPDESALIPHGCATAIPELGSSAVQRRQGSGADTPRCEGCEGPHPFDTTVPSPAERDAEGAKKP